MPSAETPRPPLSNGSVWSGLVATKEARTRLQPPPVLRPRSRKVTFRDGEEIRTEISAKFTHDAVERELAEADLRLDNFFTDERGLFGLAVARRHP
jgi:uncharacterized SAM-dependent methyltransferase